MNENLLGQWSDSPEICFTHDSYSHQSPIFLELIQKFSFEGYGIYWLLIEHLRNQTSKGSKYRLHKEKLKVISFTHHIELSKLEGIVKFCIENGLFGQDGDFFFSVALTLKMEAFSERQRKAVNRRWEKQRLGKTAKSQKPIPEHTVVYHGIPEHTYNDHEMNDHITNEDRINDLRGDARGVCNDVLENRVEEEYWGCWESDVEEQSFIVDTVEAVPAPAPIPYPSTPIPKPEPAPQPQVELVEKRTNYGGVMLTALQVAELLALSPKLGKEGIEHFCKEQVKYRIDKKLPELSNPVPSLKKRIIQHRDNSWTWFSANPPKAKFSKPATPAPKPFIPHNLRPKTPQKPFVYDEKAYQENLKKFGLSDVLKKRKFENEGRVAA